MPLTLSLINGEQIAIVGHNVALTVRIIRQGGGRVMLSVDAPRSMNVERQNAAGESLCTKPKPPAVPPAPAVVITQPGATCKETTHGTAA